MHRAKGDRFVRANELPVRQWYMNIIFVCNEELKVGTQGYLLCLLGNQLKFQLQPFGCKRARDYYVRTLVGTLVQFEVGQYRRDLPFHGCTFLVGVP